MQTRSGSGTIERFCAAIAFFLACFSTNLRAAPIDGDALKHLLAPPVVAAHRGGYFEPGNPLKKIRTTLNAGAARVLEIDLRLTLDGVVIVSHDEDLSGGGCFGNVDKTAYAALAACERALAGQPITRFEDVLHAVNGRAVVNAEFKTEEVIAPAIGIVRARHAKSWVYFQATGDLTKYHMARHIDAEIALLLKVTSDDEIRQAIALHDPHLVILELDRDFVSPQRVSRIHAAHMLVSENSFRYQFTEERFDASCDRVFGLGVDIAVTNNASSCAAQRGMWRKDRGGHDSTPFDRQHLRADFGGNKYALELFFAGIGILVIALVIPGLAKSFAHARTRSVGRNLHG